MKKHFLLFLVFFLIKINLIFSQEEKTKQLPSIGVGVGVLSFNGDVGEKLNLSSFSRIRSGYTFFVAQRLGMHVGIALSGLYGKVANSEQSQGGNLNFESSIMQGGLNVMLHLDNDVIFKRNSIIAPYLVAGVEFLKFDSYGDLKNSNGIKYNYWKDGTIRNLPENDPQAINSIIILRDYTYETQLVNSTENYKRTALAIPLGIGFKLKATEVLFVNLSSSFNLTSTDWIDNYKAGKNDGYLFTNLSIEYNFRKRKKTNAAVNGSVDFAKLDNSDLDKDGVKDMDDNCLETPKGVKVDSNGCPEDTDGNGVPDYLDKEKNTLKKKLVNQKDSTSKSATTPNNQFSTVDATQRSDLFNQNPSLAYLKDLEAKKANQNKASINVSIPDELKVADTNKNGLISIDEILAAIDSFFEGNNEYTVEKLNDLIDLYFEQ